MSRRYLDALVCPSSNYVPQGQEMKKRPQKARVLALIALAYCMANSEHLMAQPFDDTHPDPTPQNEKILIDETGFVAQCRSRIAVDEKEFNWIIGNSVLTQSREFGLVWRADFRVAGRPADSLDLVNRIICWRPRDTNDIRAAFLFGTPVPKLE
jgi:hypothetical protein